jgi:hypothetical protein
MRNPLFHHNAGVWDGREGVLQAQGGAAEQGKKALATLTQPQQQAEPCRLRRGTRDIFLS